MTDEVRTTAGHWLKGTSGNPGGFSKEKRQAVALVAELARQHTPQAIQTLANIMTDEKASKVSRVAAANALLDRAWGRAPQVMTLESDPDVLNESHAMFDAARRIAFTLALGVKAREETTQLRATAAEAELLEQTNGDG